MSTVLVVGSKLILDATYFLLEVSFITTYIIGKYIKTSMGISCSYIGLSVYKKL